VKYFHSKLTKEKKEKKLASGGKKGRRKGGKASFSLLKNRLAKKKGDPEDFPCITKCCIRLTGKGKRGKKEEKGGREYLRYPQYRWRMGKGEKKGSSGVFRPSGGKARDGGGKERTIQFLSPAQHKEKRGGKGKWRVRCLLPPGEDKKIDWGGRRKDSTKQEKIKGDVTLRPHGKGKNPYKPEEKEEALS